MRSDRLLDELLPFALLGTERRTPPALPQGADGDRLGTLLASLPASATDEWRLLAAAAIASVHARAGHVPAIPAVAATRVFPPAPADSMPCVSPLAERLLADLIGGRFVELLPEWLELAAANRRRAPDRLLPLLLEWGRTQPELRQAVALVLGARGLWLAAQNPDWDYAAGGATHDQVGAQFETASRAARLSILRALRDAEPARARDLLGQTWRDCPAEERAVLLDALAINLSPDDEAFLETALDDRAREVRRAAAELLARLPGSRLTARMIGRVRPRMVLSSWFKKSLEVTLPEACDEGMARDGVQPKPPAGVGERAWWMTQMLGMVPPSLWTQHWKRPPEEILRASERGEWGALCAEGWARAAERHRDATWAEALLRTRNEESTRRLMRLMDVLPPARREALVEAELAARIEPIRPMHEGPLALLRFCRHPWSPKFTRQVIAAFRAEERVNAGAHMVLQSLLSSMARFMDPAIAADPAAVGLSPDDKSRSRWPALMDKFIPVLQVRLDLRRAFSAEPRP